MLQWRFGAVEVVRVEELIWPVPIGFLFPQLGEADFAPYMDWLAPTFVSADYRMLLSQHAFVLRTPHHTIVVDTCVGNDRERHYPEWTHLHTAFPARLAAAGVAPEAVDYVFCTHLHADHVGWNTRLAAGAWVPMFPNARYLFHRPEYEHWMNMPEADWPPALHDSVLPIVRAGLARPVDGDFALDDAVWLEPTPGHTPGHCSVHLGSAGAEAVITGDMLHNAVQIAAPHWPTRACSDPALAVATREAFVRRYADTAVQVLGTHFAPPTAVRIRGEGDRLRPVW